MQSAKLSSVPPPLLDTVMSRINPNINTSYFWNVHFNIILLTLSYSSIRPSFGNFTTKKSYNFYYYFLGYLTTVFQFHTFYYPLGQQLWMIGMEMAIVSLFEGYYTCTDWGSPQETSVVLIKLQSKITKLGTSSIKGRCAEHSNKTYLRISCFSFGLDPLYRNFHYPTDAPTSVQKRALFKLSPVSTLFTTLPPWASALYTVQHRLLLTWSASTAFILGKRLWILTVSNAVRYQRCCGCKESPECRVYINSRFIDISKTDK